MSDHISGMTRWLLGFFVTTLYLFLYVPIVVMVIFSCNSEPFPAPWKQFTLSWYHELFQTEPLWHALRNSCIIALVATFLSVVFGLIIMHFLVHQKRTSSWVVTFFYGSIIIPEVVLAVALVGFFTVCSIPLGMMTLVIAHTVLGTGYVVPILYTRYRELDTRLIEASQDLGATTDETFFNVIVPLLKPALLGAALLTFILSFDDFVLSYFCAGGTSQTLSLYILGALRSGVTPVVNALSTFLLLLSSLLVLVLCSFAVRSKLL